MSSAASGQRDMVLSGGFGKSSSSARSGYLPIAIERAPLEAFDGIAVYLRTLVGSERRESFTLYCNNTTAFTLANRDRLMRSGVKFIYIPIADHQRFRQQVETKLEELARDPAIAISARSEIVYETSVELMNEILSEQDLQKTFPRLERVARAVTTLTLNDPASFDHLFTASHHDFYTATHVVNVATWMVPLAYLMGYHDPDELNHICQAGLLHDMGKIFIPAETLNKRGKLTEAEWAQIRSHPELGAAHLDKCSGIAPIVRRVTLEHHERMDGSGYPRGISGEDIDPVSRICAVVDSFDAMTALRPFKQKTMSPEDAMQVILRETPDKYDGRVVEAWLKLLSMSGQVTAVPEADLKLSERHRRSFPRFKINCAARVHMIEQTAEGLHEHKGHEVIAHNISRFGMGFLSQKLIRPGERLRIYLRGVGAMYRVDEGIVMRSRPYDDGWNETGIQFASLISEDQIAQLQALGAERPPALP